MAAPLPVCYLNGRFEPLEQARISPLDRGFLFADSVYEVLPVFERRPFLFREHFERLNRSLDAIRMHPPHSHEQWLAILTQLIERNGSPNCYLYVQVTRGAELGRNHPFPANSTPTIFAMACPLPQLTAEQREHGLTAITAEDFRWERCDIKSTMLLANVLLKQQATDAGANEAILVRQGEVMEGSSTSVFAMIKGVLVTPPNSNRVLPGTTRDAVLQLAQGHIPTQIRRLSLDDLYAAEEVWISAATRDVLPITRIDERVIGGGTPGRGWLKMCELFDQQRRRLAGTPAL